ncbi:hypothetical protein [Virgibacillus profundi]|nr:hypothetical protein [Virgibacillus profundi]
MAMTADKLADLRKEMKLIKNNLPVLKSGENGKIELDPKNPLHREWYKGR